MGNKHHKLWLADRIEEQEGRCYWCGEAMLCTPEERHAAETFNHPLRATLDHVEPLCQGGADTIANTVAACLECNTWKGSAMPDDFVALALANQEEAGR